MKLGRAAVAALLTAHCAGMLDMVTLPLWVGALVAPHRYAVDGAWRGMKRRTLMDYVSGQPSILRLEPPNDAEREPVPAAFVRRASH